MNWPWRINLLLSLWQRLWSKPTTRSIFSDDSISCQVYQEGVGNLRIGKFLVRNEVGNTPRSKNSIHSQKRPQRWTVSREWCHPLHPPLPQHQECRLLLIYLLKSWNTTSVIKVSELTCLSPSSFRNLSLPLIYPIFLASSARWTLESIEFNTLCLLEAPSRV